LAVVAVSELSRVMIFRNDHARVLVNACWSCGKSDTYCDGLIDREDRWCCDPCRDEPHNPHTGLDD
jgi:hypothetical protein